MGKLVRGVGIWVEPDDAATVRCLLEDLFRRSTEIRAQIEGHEELLDARRTKGLVAVAIADDGHVVHADLLPSELWRRGDIAGCASTNCVRLFSHWPPSS